MSEFENPSMERALSLEDYLGELVVLEFYVSAIDLTAETRKTGIVRNSFASIQLGFGLISKETKVIIKFVFLL